MGTIQLPVHGQLRHFRVNNTGTEDDPLVPVRDVYIQDQTSPIIMLPMVQQLGLNTLAINAVVDEYTVELTDATGVTAGKHFRIINAAADRYYFGTILDVTGDIVTLDTPIDFAYVAGSEITWSNVNMVVNGSVTPVEFELRTGTPSIPSSVDITGLRMVCECTTPVDLSKFGNLGALTRGVVFRITNGTTHNIFNAKANRDLVNVSAQFDPYLATNPAHDVDGFVWDFSLKDLGIAIRVDQYGNLTTMIQDDLTAGGLLTSLTVWLEGHVVV